MNTFGIATSRAIFYLYRPEPPPPPPPYELNLFSPSKSANHWVANFCNFIQNNGKLKGLVNKNLRDKNSKIQF